MIYRNRGEHGNHYNTAAVPLFEVYLLCLADLILADSRYSYTGTCCAANLASLFLYLYETDFMRKGFSRKTTWS
jgi:hypothetical protein